MNCRKSQVWIETVIYTLIIMTIIGVVLGIVKPSIDEKKDQAIITQSIDVLNSIDEKVNEVKYAPGNSREVEVKLTKGKLAINGAKDKIMILVDDSRYQYGELGQEIKEGNIIIENNQDGKLYMINLTLSYADKFDITWNKEDTTHYIQPGPALTKILITNLGKEGTNLINIDFS